MELSLKEGTKPLIWDWICTWMYIIQRVNRNNSISDVKKGYKKQVQPAFWLPNSSWACTYLSQHCESVGSDQQPQDEYDDIRHRYHRT
jgi:hypothetical protein